MDSNVLFLKYEDMHRVSAQEAVSRARALPVARSPWSVAVGVTQPGLCQTQASGGKVGLRSSECAQRSSAGTAGALPCPSPAPRAVWVVCSALESPVRCFSALTVEV